MARFALGWKAAMALSITLGLAACASTGGSAEKTEKPLTGVELGRYIVMNSASCVSCHRMTLPGDEAKPLRAGRQGPDLGRLSDERMQKMIPMISTGEGTPRNMPVYRLSAKDTDAVAAYLKMLKAGNQPAAPAPLPKPAPVAQ